MALKDLAARVEQLEARLNAVERLAELMSADVPQFGAKGDRLDFAIAAVAGVVGQLCITMGIPLDRAKEWAAALQDERPPAEIAALTSALLKSLQLAGAPSQGSA